MKKKEFVILCLRLLGIFFFVMGLSHLPNLAKLFKKLHTADVTYYFYPVIHIICGSVLFIYAPRISNLIIEFSEAEEDNIQISISEKTTRIAFLVLGVYIFAQTLPLLIQISVNVLIYYQDVFAGVSQINSAKNQDF